MVEADEVWRYKAIPFGGGTGGESQKFRCLIEVSLGEHGNGTANEGREGPRQRLN